MPATPSTTFPFSTAIVDSASVTSTDRTRGTIPESVVASRWRQEVFEPTVAAVPEELWAALPAAEVFHQVLEHRWFLSERARKDVGIDEAVRSYVESVLPSQPAERVVLELPDPD